MANQVTPSVSLQSRIQQLEELQKKQVDELKASAGLLLHSLSPVQLLKSTLKEVSSTPNLKSNILNTAMGIGAGFIGRKLYGGKSNSIIRKIAGPAIQFFITNFVRNKLSKRQDKPEVPVKLDAEINN